MICKFSACEVLFFSSADVLTACKQRVNIPGIAVDFGWFVRVHRTPIPVTGDSNAAADRFAMLLPK